MRALLSLYAWSYAKALTYMLQNTEYEVLPYLRWYWRTRNFSQVEYRRELVKTKAARLINLSLNIGMLLQYTTGLTLLYFSLANGLVLYRLLLSLVIILIAPIVWAHLIVIPLWLGYILVISPRRRKYIARAERIFADHKAVKIAIVGSYGKTSMKEMLAAAIGQGLKVAVTPANENVAISHARFANSLEGDEDVIIIEYGEGAPGDVTKFALLTHPTHAIITGLAPAHLDKYKTLDAAAEDIFSVCNFVDHNRVFVNGDSSVVMDYARPEHHAYSSQGVLGWTPQNISIKFSGTEFTIKNKKSRLLIKSKLLGEHQIGPLSLCAVIANLMGLSHKDVETNLASLEPYPHRMQPYELMGAQIIDDTYNGNIEGIKAGTKLLAALPASRKIYVTPGLVDQGSTSQSVHNEMGRLIAKANPDIVVLMQNSATQHIQHGLSEQRFAGEVRIEHRPLEFYLGLQSFVAAGDLVIMQNDWTDNYH